MSCGERAQGIGEDLTVGVWMCPNELHFSDPAL